MVRRVRPALRAPDHRVAPDLRVVGARGASQGSDDFSGLPGESSLSDAASLRLPLVDRAGGVRLLLSVGAFHSARGCGYGHQLSGSAGNGALGHAVSSAGPGAADALSLALPAAARPGPRGTGQSAGQEKV